MALDFIAELFRIEDEKNLVVLHDYFISMDLKNMSDRELTSELRKLVFTKVDDNIYRFYGKKDSSLKKLFEISKWLSEAGSLLTECVAGMDILLFPRYRPEEKTIDAAGFFAFKTLFAPERAHADSGNFD
jgi:hypothetical protein